MPSGKACCFHHHMSLETKWIMITLCGMSKAKAFPFFRTLSKLTWLLFTNTKSTPHSFYLEICCNDDQVRLCWRCLFCLKNKRGKNYTDSSSGKKSAEADCPFSNNIQQKTIGLVCQADKEFLLQDVSNELNFLLQFRDFFKHSIRALQIILLVETKLINFFFLACFQYQR